MAGREGHGLARSQAVQQESVQRLCVGRAASRSHIHVPRRREGQVPARPQVRRGADAQGDGELPEIIAEKRKMYKGVSANVDFYSGLIYSMLGLPIELYTPIFAIARIAGWSAHRMEEIISGGKIIRPAYKPVGEDREYMPVEERI